MGWSIKIEFNIHIYRDCEKRNDTVSPDIANRSFLKAMNDEISKLEGARSLSTISNYRCALKSFMQFLKKDVLTSDIKPELLESFERWLRNNSVCQNSISCYMRSLRSLMSKIYGDYSKMLFSKVYTGRARTEKRAIPESDIARIKALKLKKGSFMSLARDIFLFSYYALGMPFVDICFLRKSQISYDKLVYERHKTGQKVIVRLEPCMTEIISRYRQKDSDYVFPLLMESEPKAAYKQYLSKLACYNKTLNLLADKAGISHHLTSYTPRHTWASVAYSSNVDLPVISKALGHSNPQTTLTYIKEIDDNRLDDANHSIVSRII
jgi:integrase